MGDIFLDPDPTKQFASSVVFFSSQYGGENSQSYGALNLAGNSYNYPSYGDFTQAFVLRSYGPWWDLTPSGRRHVNRKSRKNFISEDFVDLEFKDYVIPTKIEILETYNPGAVVRILALLPGNSNSNQGSDKKRWTTLWSGEPQQCRPQARKFSPQLREIKYPTNLIRLEFNQQHLNYYTELDAVFLYGIPASKTSSGEQKFPTVFGDSDMSLTAHLFRQLSLNEEKEDLQHNGFFDVLPSELIHYIFSFLELIDLIRAARTCRLFFLHCYDPVWYKELDLKPYWSLITNDALDSLHTRCTSTEKLDLSWSGPYGAITAPSICRFLQHCGSKLVCLRLSCCQFVDNEVIQSVCQHCPNLEELDLQSCNSKSLNKDGLLRLQTLKKLKRINFYRVNELTDDVMEELTHSLKSLQHLNLGGRSTLFESADILMQSLSVYCRNVSNSEMASPKSIQIFLPFESLLHGCNLTTEPQTRGLVSLDLWRSKGLTSDGVVCLAEGCVLLEELDIGWCTNVTSVACVVNLVSKCKKLKKLFLTAIRCINDDVLDALTDNCPDIEQVDVLGTGLIHSNSLTRLLRQCKKLLFLDVSFCSQLSTELIRNLQAMYPNVSLKKSFVVNEDPL